MHPIVVTSRLFLCALAGDTKDLALISAVLQEGPEVCINEHPGNTPNFIAPELIIASLLLDDCEDLDEMDGNMCNVAAADAWAAGAIILLCCDGILAC